MRLNLGCGTDIKPGYVNVDRRPLPGVTCLDLSGFPWPWKNGQAEEVLMLDFLEHFPYRKTELIIQEAWRVLMPSGVINIQVPDFDHCAHAAMREPPYMCNRCGWAFVLRDMTVRKAVDKGCPKCKQTLDEIALEAIHRLYGGQDYEGNWHHTAFTKGMLISFLKRNGFVDVRESEYNEKGETYYQNWNFFLSALKSSDLWE